MMSKLRKITPRKLTKPPPPKPPIIQPQLRMPPPQSRYNTLSRSSPSTTSISTITSRFLRYKHSVTLHFHPQGCKKLTLYSNTTNSPNSPSPLHSSPYSPVRPTGQKVELSKPPVLHLTFPHIHNNDNPHGVMAWILLFQL